MPHLIVIASGSLQLIILMATCDCQIRIIKERRVQLIVEQEVGCYPHKPATCMPTAGGMSLATQVYL